MNPQTGYGEIRVGGRLQSTHRAAFAAFVADPGSKHVLHRCDTRSCINPDHLFLGTNRDNIADSVSKGRRKGVARNRPRGLKYHVPVGAHDCKLKVPRSEWPNIMQRLQAGEKQSAVAAAYSVHQATISNIKRRLTCGY